MQTGSVLYFWQLTSPFLNPLVCQTDSDYLEYFDSYTRRFVCHKIYFSSEFCNRSSPYKFAINHIKASTDICRDAFTCSSITFWMSEKFRRSCLVFHAELKGGLNLKTKHYYYYYFVWTQVKVVRNHSLEGKFPEPGSWARWWGMVAQALCIARYGEQFVSRRICMHVYACRKTSNARSKPVQLHPSTPRKTASCGSSAPCR